jgi:hypothetical protein
MLFTLMYNFTGNFVLHPATRPNQLPYISCFTPIIGVVNSGIYWFQREKHGLSVSAKMDCL